jgi:hypothetical protein
MRIRSKLVQAVAAAVGCVAVGSAPADGADAGLVIDLRPVAINGNPISVPDQGDAPEVINAQALDVVSVNIYARVTGTNTVNDEAFSGIQGVFRTPTGGMLIDLQSTVAAPFNTLGSQNGTPLDVDLDGDFDIGDRPNGGLASTYFIARATEPVTDGVVVGPGSEEFLIGTMTLTIKDASLGDGFIDFIRRRNPGNPGSNNAAYAFWHEDGTGSESARTGLSPYSVDGIIVPEPAGVALTSLAASLGLLARRRRTRPSESL